MASVAVTAFVPAELCPDHVMAAGRLTQAELLTRNLGHRRLLLAACPCGHAAPHRVVAHSPTGLARVSDRADVLGLRALGALGGGELDPLVVQEAAVTISLDGGVVNEDIGGAVVGGDETIALVGVEPLHCALSHGAFSC